MVKAVVLYGGKGKNPVANVVLGRLLVRWVLVKERMLVLMVLLVVGWWTVAGLADAACL